MVYTVMFQSINIKQMGIKFWRLLRFVTRRFILNDGTYRSAALAFMSLLAIVPLMSVSFTVLSAFPVFKDASKPIQDFIFASFVPATGQLVQQYLEGFVQSAAKLSVIGLTFLFVTAVLLMFTIESAFNQIWCVRHRRSGVSAFLLYWATLTLIPVLLGCSLVISSYFLSLHIFASSPLQVLNNRSVLAIMPFILSWIFFTVIYVAIPNCKVMFRYAIQGGLFAAILFSLEKWAFSFYVGQFNTYELLYGAFATIPIFFLWIYYLWTIILLGAEVTHALSAHYDRRLEAKIDGFTHAIRWLHHLWIAQRDGNAITSEELINADPYNYEVLPHKQLARLLEAKLIRPTSHGRYILARDLSTMTLLDVYHALPWQLPSSSRLDGYTDPVEVNLRNWLLQMELASAELWERPVQSLFV